MPPVLKIKGRYEVKEVIGRGGMGIVYKAYDTEVRREVAVKTIGDLASQAALDLFYKEWQVLANMHHPNIVEIFDIGEFNDRGVIKPFFVMPMLRGTTLDQLASIPGQPFPPERLVQIMSQLCRGLHAAHENGLIHRDLKPSNVFVMEHDSVKLIDFGIAHLVGGAATGIKGTPWYMSPEQIRNQVCTPASDIFSLGVLCYEVLAGVLPYKGLSTQQIFESVLNYIPPPVCDLNPAISQPISRVIHKAMAKQPQHRFSNALAFSETLLKALRNEPIDFFDPARIQPRIQHARRFFEQGRYQMSADILSDLEAAGHIDPALTPLRRQIDQALRQKSIADLLERARNGIAEDEYHLALQSAEELLKLDPANQEAIRLKQQIEQDLGEKQIEEWLEDARISLNSRHYAYARQTLRKVIDLLPGHPEASGLLVEVELREEEYRKARLEKERLYQAAREAWDNCEFASALAKLKRVMELDELAPDTSAPESRGNYINFHSMVESAEIAVERAVAEFAAACEAHDFARARDLCDENLAKFPGHPLFRGLRLTAAEGAAQYKAELISGSCTRAIEEPSSERRLAMIQQAAEAYPGETYFDQWLKPLKEKAELAAAIAAKARDHEQRDQFPEALERWIILRRIDVSYPGIDGEIERLIPLAEGGFPQPRIEKSDARLTTTLNRPTTAVTALPSTQPDPSPPAPAVPLALRLAIIQADIANRLAALKSRVLDWRNRASGNFAALRYRSGALSRRISHSVPWLLRVSLAILFLVVGAVVVTKLIGVPPLPPPPPPLLTLLAVIHSPVSGAAIKINGKEAGIAAPDLRLQLPPGTYEVEASLSGHRVLSDSLVVAASSSNQITLTSFVPMPPVVRLIADFEGGMVSVDKQLRGSFKDSQFILEDPGPGKHSINAADGRNSVTINFEIIPGAVPFVTGVSRHGLSALVVASLGDHSYIFTNIEKPKYSIDGVSQGEIGLAGIPVKGTPELIVGELKDSPRIRLGNSPAPSLLAHLYSDRNVGTLSITVPGADAFEVLLDRQTKTLRIQNSTMRIASLPVKSYHLTVRREGFEDFDSDVTIRKGAEETPPIQMKPKLQLAALRIEGAQPDAEVSVDKTVVGKVAADGSFQFASVSPGEHEILLRKQPAFRDKAVRRNFKPHAAVVITKADLFMDKNPATIALEFPAGAKVFYKCGDESQVEIAQATSVTCKEGPFNARASRPGHVDEARSIMVTAGEVVKLTLDPKIPGGVPQIPIAITCAITDLSAARGWSLGNGLYQVKANGKGLLPCAGTAGRYEFIFKAPKGNILSKAGRRMTWVITPDAGAPLSYSIDRKSFYRPSGDQQEISNYLQNETFTIRVEVTPSRIVHSIKTEDGNWHQLDAEEKPNRNNLKARISFPGGPGGASITGFSFIEHN